MQQSSSNTPQIHVERHSVLPAEAIGLQNCPEFAGIPDAKAPFRAQSLRHSVKGEAEGLAEQLGKQLPPAPGSL